MTRFAIIVIGYNRLLPIKRLANMLNMAVYDEKIDLIFSIDRSDDESVINFANDFIWKYGDKIVRTFPERQGLKKHILKCGDYLYDYDAVIVLEDDVIVSKYFFMYTKASYEKYHNDMNIAGVSLYTHARNVISGESFIPAYNGFDTFFMQFAQSWGQVWFKKQWFDFVDWLKRNEGTSLAADNFPQYISDWGASSWLKYHIKYCVDNNKFFVYPYISFSSCFSDEGEHTNKKSNLLHVPLSEGWNPEYKFDKLENISSIKYDVFFERIGFDETIGLDDVTIDIYGMKNKFKTRYVLSSQKLDYNCIKSYGLSLRPHENNVIYSIPGEMIFLYDTQINQKNSFKKISKRKLRVERFKYYYNLYSNGKEQVETTIDKIICELKERSTKKK